MFKPGNTQNIRNETEGLRQLSAMISDYTKPRGDNNDESNLSKFFMNGCKDAPFAGYASAIRKDPSHPKEVAIPFDFLPAAPVLNDPLGHLARKAVMMEFSAFENEVVARVKGSRSGWTKNGNLFQKALEKGFQSLGYLLYLLQTTEPSDIHTACTEASKKLTQAMMLLNNIKRHFLAFYHTTCDQGRLNYAKHAKLATCFVTDVNQLFDINPDKTEINVKDAPATIDSRLETYSSDMHTAVRGIRDLDLVSILSDICSDITQELDGPKFDGPFSPKSPTEPPPEAGTPPYRPVSPGEPFQPPSPPRERDPATWGGGNPFTSNTNYPILEGIAIANNDREAGEIVIVPSFLSEYDPAHPGYNGSTNPDIIQEFNDIAGIITPKDAPSAKRHCPGP